MRLRSFVVVGVPCLLGIAGCATPSLTNEHAQVAYVEPRADASWTETLDLAPTDPGTQCPTGLVNDESRNCVPHEIAQSHDTKYVDFPDRMARIAGASFALDVTEVTVDAYARCVKAGACTEPARVREIQSNEIIEIESRCNYGREDKGAHPVNCVDFRQAKAYCAWAGKRLPTDAEWAMAATGVDGDRRFPWGDRPAKRGRLDVCVGEGTCIVGSHPFDVTPDGVMDMGGSVTEWVEGPTESAASQRVRGGNWFNGGSWADAARGGTVYARMSSTRHDHVMGFRCARDS